MTKTSPQYRSCATNIASFVLPTWRRTPSGGIGPTSRGFAFVAEGGERLATAPSRARSPMDSEPHPSTSTVTTTGPTIDLHGDADSRSSA
jgi:hypothetical protein